jgi:3'-phosphoadenosine 5'-phosphosulfate sulfotransferase (PAPS reductase)/FAD synthetase
MDSIMHPYLIDLPFVFHFSGGRTSGYLLKHVLDAWGGCWPDSGIDNKPCPIVFTNTGKEFEQTLEFVAACAHWWDIEQYVYWLEYTDKKEDGKGYRIVNFETASRNGEPFEIMIGKKAYLPNTVQRLCTQDLKILTCDRFLVDYWGRPEYNGLTGIRFDEPRRWKSGGPDPRNSHRTTIHPLRTAKVTQVDVLTWWKAQPFDLQLRPHESNCDLCFLKSNAKRIQIMLDYPERAEWWMDQERKNRARYPDRALTTAGFRAGDRKDYQTLYQISVAKSLDEDGQPFRFGELEGENELDEDLIDCHCTD